MRSTDHLPGRSLASRLTLVATLLVAASPLRAASPADANLLPNPSFEEGGDSPAGWGFRAWGGTEDRALRGVARPGRSGRCATIRSSGRGGVDAAWTARVRVAPRTFYRLSGWIRAREVRGARGALLNIQNMQHVKTSAVRGSRGWTRVATVFRTADEPTELEINCLFGGWGVSTGQAWFDDVALERVSDLSERREASLTIDPDAPPTPYSRLLFGGFIEHFDRQIHGGIFAPGSALADADGFRRDVVTALKELRLSVVRWPGGCFASGYHWRRGVGPAREPTPDPVWGGQDPNTFGTDEFVAWCRLVGCEPYICTNAGDGSVDEMRDWVEYCNASEGPAAGLRRTGGRERPLGVRYWSIGNENWGAHEIGARTPEEWGPLVRDAARRMLEVDPELILVAAATPDRGWTLPLLRAAGDHLDLVAIHQYWLPCWGENLTPDYLSSIVLSEGPEETISRVIDLLDESGRRGRIRIAFDEWNLRGWHHPGFPRKEPSDPRDPETARRIRDRRKNAVASQYTMADALFSASFLNACLRHASDVQMANIAPIVNTRGPLFVHPGGVVRRTTFHALAMYARELESHVGHALLESGMLVHADRFVPVVDAVATVRADGTAWSIALVNRHPSEEVACTIRMGERLPEGTAEAVVLAGDSPDAFNDVEHPRRVEPERATLSIRKGLVRLRPHSLTVLRLAAP